jgi:lipopolysaccharide transport system ATP-binding protein
MANPTWTKCLFENNAQIDVGIFTYGKPTIVGNGHITIGKFTLMGPNVELLPLGDHRWEWSSTFPFNEIESFKWTMKAQPHRLNTSRRFNIAIGSDVWLGMGSKILHGANIGDGAVVGAYSVVAGEVEPYSVVVGNPAREIHKRFSDEIIEVMMKIKWWDWPVEIIIQNLEILTAPPDIEKLEAVWLSLNGTELDTTLPTLENS